MRHTPTEQQIHDAELRVAASRERTRAAVFSFRGLVDAKVAEILARINSIEARLTKPSSLAIFVGVGIIVGKRLSRRKPRLLKRSPRQFAGGVAVALGAFISRFAWKLLSASLLRLVAAARQRYDAPRPAYRPQRPVALPPVKTLPRNAGETVH